MLSKERNQLDNLRPGKLRIEERELGKNIASVCSRMEKDGTLRDGTSFTTVNEDYEVVKAVISQNLSCEVLKSENFHDDRRHKIKESLKSFIEHHEFIDKQWVASLKKDTRDLELWRKRTATNYRNIRGEAFARCSIPHSHQSFPSTGKLSKNEDFENYNGLALEATLSRISRVSRSKLKGVPVHIDGEDKFRLNVKCENSPDVLPNVALEKYCQQHAYSRVRLLRTDRRALANELLERMAAQDDETQVSLNRSPKFASTRDSTSSLILPTRLNTENVSLERQKALRRSSNPSSLVLNKNDRKQSQWSHPLVCDRATKSISSMKSNGDQMVEKNLLAAKMHEPLMVTPCVFFPTELPSESKNRIVRHHKSVPRCASINLSVHENWNTKLPNMFSCKQKFTSPTLHQ